MPRTLTKCIALPKLSFYGDLVTWAGTVRTSQIPTGKRRDKFWEDKQWKKMDILDCKFEKLAQFVNTRTLQMTRHCSDDS